MEPFYITVYNDETSTLEVVSAPSNNHQLTENIDILQKYGMKVHCIGHAGPIKKEDGALLSGFKYKDGLYQSLLLEYERKTLKTLKRW